MVLQAGQQPIPGYSLTQRLGRGGFGEVWAAPSPQRQSVALKFIDCQGKLSSTIAHEIRMMRGLKDLRHPYFIRLHDVRERGYRERVLTDAADRFVRFQRIYESADRLARVVLTPEREVAQLWQSATELQRKAAADLQELARALRAPPDKLAASREARERIDKALEKQELLRDDAQAQRDPRVQDREKLDQKDGVARHAQEQAEQQEHVREQTRRKLRPRRTRNA